MTKRMRGEPKGFWRSMLWFMGDGPERQRSFNRAREATLREVIGSDLELHNPCHDRIRERLEEKLKASIEGRH